MLKEKYIPFLFVSYLLCLIGSVVKVLGLCVIDLKARGSSPHCKALEQGS